MQIILIKWTCDWHWQWPNDWIVPWYNTNPIATIKNKMKPKEAVKMSRTRGRTCSSDIVLAAGGRGERWQTVWVFVYTIKPWHGVCEGEAGRFSTKCLICCRVKISSLKAYEVALRRMVLCYLSSGCNYSVWTLLRRAFRDEKGRERARGVEAENGWSQRTNGTKARKILCSRQLFTTAMPELVSHEHEVNLV